MTAARFTAGLEYDRRRGEVSKTTQLPAYCLQCFMYYNFTMLHCPSYTLNLWLKGKAALQTMQYIIKILF